MSDAAEVVHEVDERGTALKPLRIGILGAARISPLSLVAPAHALGHRLVAVAARDRRRAEAFAHQHRIERVHDSYQALLADPEIEVVYNPLANSLHGAWNLAAVRAGKHVLSEKPFASNAAEARLVRDTAAAAGVHVGEGFHYVYHPVMRRLEGLLDSGQLGELREIQADMFMPAPPPEDVRWSLELSGGALMDLGCYSLHVLRRLARWADGPPRLVVARAGERRGHPGVDEWLDADLVFPSGVTGSARCNMAADEWAFECRLVGSRGTARAPNFVLPHLDDRVVVTTGSDSRVERLGTTSSYTFQLQAFAASLREGAPFPTDADDAVESMGLIDACYAAAGLPLRASSLVATRG
jgi:predicted dehydrogenase